MDADTLINLAVAVRVQRMWQAVRRQCVDVSVTSCAASIGAHCEGETGVMEAGGGVAQACDDDVGGCQLSHEPVVEIRFGQSLEHLVLGEVVHFETSVVHDVVLIHAHVAHPIHDGAS
eukprot:m.124226 g.124226  ORF g.124226 m.124226 type:complete len:118 (-) comp13772_c0_seq2:1549-1902(-)